MERNLAVLIDFENLATGCEKEGLGRFALRVVMNRMKDKGRVLVTRAYADWTQWGKHKYDLFEQGVALQELSTRGTIAKNRADMALCVEAMELAFTKEYIDTFVILSGDSDFTPLVTRLKELNKRVIGCGTKGSTSRIFANLCDEFYFYDNLVKESRAYEQLLKEPASPPRAQQRPAGAPPAAPSEEVEATGAGDPRAAAYQLLVETLENLQEDEPAPVHGSVLKSSMKRKVPTFSEEELGFRTFTRFLEAAADAGHVQLARDDKAGGYRVDLPSRANERAPVPDSRGRGDAGDGRPRNEAVDERLANEEAGDMRGSTQLRGGSRDGGPRDGGSRDGGDGRREGRGETRGRGSQRDMSDGRGSRPPTRPPVVEPGPRGASDSSARVELPGTAADRRALAERFVAICQERAERGRRTTPGGVIGELHRICRVEGLPIPPGIVKAFVTALARRGLLLHADGAPIRAMTATFVPPTDPVGLVQALEATFSAAVESRPESDGWPADVIDAPPSGDDGAHGAGFAALPPMFDEVAPPADEGAARLTVGGAGLDGPALEEGAVGEAPSPEAEGIADAPVRSPSKRRRGGRRGRGGGDATPLAEEPLVDAGDAAQVGVEAGVAERAASVDASGSSPSVHSSLPTSDISDDPPVVQEEPVEAPPRRRARRPRVSRNPSES